MTERTLKQHSNPISCISEKLIQVAVTTLPEHHKFDAWLYITG